MIQPLRWEAGVAYVGQLEVGRIEVERDRSGIWVSMIDNVPGSQKPFGVANVDNFSKALRAVEENWERVLAKMEGRGA